MVACRGACFLVLRDRAEELRLDGLRVAVFRRVGEGFRRVDVVRVREVDFRDVVLRF